MILYCSARARAERDRTRAKRRRTLPDRGATSAITVTACTCAFSRACALATVRAVLQPYRLERYSPFVFASGYSVGQCSFALVRSGFSAGAGGV